MGKAKRVLHVLMALDQGGIENMIMNLYRSIDRKSIQFDFALMEGRKSVFDEEVLEKGGRIFYFSKKKKNRFYSYYENLTDIFSMYGPFSAVHSHCYFFSGFILMLAKAYGIKIRIAHAHDTYKGQKYNIYRNVYEFITRKCISIFATKRFGCSEAACQYVFGKKSLKKDNVCVIKNAIDISKFKYSSEKREVMRRILGVEERFVIGNVARMEDQKNPEFLLCLFKKVYEKDCSAVLLLVGDGTLREYIEGKILEYKLTGHVMLLGNRSDTADLLQAMDVFVFPSKYEGLGIAVIEAQAAALPCIISDAVPKEARIADSTTVLSLEDDLNLWIEKIMQCKQINRRICNYKAVAKSGYDIKEVADKMKVFYQL